MYQVTVSTIIIVITTGVLKGQPLDKYEEKIAGIWLHKSIWMTMDRIEWNKVDQALFDTLYLNRDRQFKIVQVDERYEGKEGIVVHHGTWKADQKDGLQLYDHSYVRLNVAFKGEDQKLPIRKSSKQKLWLELPVTTEGVLDENAIMVERLMRVLN
jgi:hypothetical protein